MNTLLLNNLRQELAKAAAGISEKYRTHQYSTWANGTTQNYLIDSGDQTKVTLSNTPALIPTDLNPGDVLFLYLDTNLTTPPKWVGRIVVSFDNLTGIVMVSQSYPVFGAGTANTDIVRKGIFLYDGIITGIKVGDGGFDILLNQPKIVTGAELDLFHPVSPGPNFFPAISLKWLGDPNNLGPLDSPEPLSTIVVAELLENDLVGATINEVGVIMDHYNNETGQIIPVTIGLSTFTPKIKDNTDIFEFTLKVNF